MYHEPGQYCGIGVSGELNLTQSIGELAKIEDGESADADVAGGDQPLPVPPAKRACERISLEISCPRDEVELVFKSVNEVLAPRVFQSDWKIHWQRDRGARSRKYLRDKARKLALKKDH